MTPSEYHELIEFLSGKFDRIDERFVRLEVKTEQNTHQIQQVAEGLTMQNERIGRLHTEMNERFQVVDSQFTSVAARFTASDEKLENFRSDVDARFTASDEKLETFRGDVDARFTASDEKLETFRSDVDARFTATDAKVEAFRGEVHGRFTATDEKVEGLRLDLERRSI